MKLFKQPSAVGLEIDTGVIRVVELKGKPGNITLSAAEKYIIPEAAVVEGVVVDTNEVACALEELWIKTGINNREVIYGVSNQGVLMRMAKFPKIPEKKLAQALRFQAGEHFPIPLNEMVFDYSITGELIGDTGLELELLLVAARREMLDKNLKALTAASITPKIIEPSTLALMHTFSEEQLKGTNVLVYVANGLSTILMITDGVPRFSRVVLHSMQSFAAQHNIALAQVLESFTNVAAAVDDNTQWGEMMANDIRGSISYYLVQQNEASVGKIILSGRGARVPGLPELLQQELDMPVEMVNPLNRINKVNKIAGVDMEFEKQDFAVCIGLALRGLEGI